jgi:hypothetical protein
MCRLRETNSAEHPAFLDFTITGITAFSTRSPGIIALGFSISASQAQVLLQVFDYRYGRVSALVAAWFACFPGPNVGGSIVHNASLHSCCSLGL